MFRRNELGMVLLFRYLMCTARLRGEARRSDPAYLGPARFVVGKGE